MHPSHVPTVAVVAGRVALVEITRRLALELLVLEGGAVAYLLEDGQVCQRLTLGRA